MSELAVELRGVSKRYPDFALRELDLELPYGQILGLIGPNGAGKSTTIRILMGLIGADQGQVRVLGHALPEHAVLAKSAIGYVGDDLRLYKSGTLAWHMEFVAQFYPSWDANYAQQLLRRLDLEPKQLIKGLSQGQRVKAALLLALARRPKLLVLDEPTTGLDPVARHEVLAALMEVVASEDRSILFSSHNTADVEQISDQIMFIDRGQRIDFGEKEDFLQRWRRLRLAVPDAVTLDLPNVVQRAGSARLPVWVTDQYQPELRAQIEASGAQVLAVEPLSLEEIFIIRVVARRATETV
jgi:ABC-2 type transport system ATP-binding protein